MELYLKDMPELAHDDLAIITSRIIRAPRVMVYQAFALFERLAAVLDRALDANLGRSTVTEEVHG